MSLEVNKRITECRRNAKMSKKEVAERLGMKYTTYCRMEKEAKRITNEEITRIAKVLGADRDYIQNGPNYNFKPLEPKTFILETPSKGVSPFDEPEAPVVAYKVGDFVISCEEKSIIFSFRRYSEKDKQKVRDLIEQLDNR